MTEKQLEEGALRKEAGGGTSYEAQVLLELKEINYSLQALLHMQLASQPKHHLGHWERVLADLRKEVFAAPQPPQELKE